MSAGATTGATKTPTASLTLSGPEKYYVLIGLLAGIILLGYVNKVLPLDTVYAGIGSVIVAGFAFFSHDLEDAHSPANLPSWTTFLVITIASGAYYGIGSFEADGMMKVGAIVTWLIVFLGYVFHTLNEDAGVNMPQNAELWAASILGIVLALLVWYESNATAGVAAFIATLTYVVPLYVHIGFDNGTISVTPVTNPPDPTKA